MKSRHSGLPASAPNFLADLARHNDADWFRANKARFEEHVKGPSLELVGALNEGLGGFAPEYRAQPGRAFGRMNRDVRFSADKSPYRTDLFVVFPCEGRPKDAAAGFYLKVMRDGVELGGGVFMPGKPQLEALRAAWAKDHAAFRRIVAEPRLGKLMGPLEGETLKRVPAPWTADHPAEDLVRRKQAYYTAKLPLGVATSPKLVPEMLARFEAMTPFCRWLDHAMAPASR